MSLFEDQFVCDVSDLELTLLFGAFVYVDGILDGDNDEDDGSAVERTVGIIEIVGVFVGRNEG